MMRTELLDNGHLWLRIVDPAWVDPLDPTFAQRHGGWWNPPHSFPTLYLNEDLSTARINLRTFIASWPYEPEDLRSDTGPCLVTARLPRQQRTGDVHTPAGVAATGLPATYPLDEHGQLVSWHRCQAIGADANRQGLRGIHCRSARTPTGAGRELAWFPATGRSRAHLVSTQAFDAWYY